MRLEEVAHLLHFLDILLIDVQGVNRLVLLARNLHVDHVVDPCELWVLDHEAEEVVRVNDYVVWEEHGAEIGVAKVVPSIFITVVMVNQVCILLKTERAVDLPFKHF